MSMYSAKGRGKLLPKATNKEYGVVKGGGDVEITNKGEIKINSDVVKPKWEVLSSDDYDALDPKDPFTVYLVTDTEGADV